MTPFAVLEKHASTALAEDEERVRDKDRKTLRNRHILLALRRAMQGATGGAVLGGLGAVGEEGGMSGGQGALLGLVAGGLAGGAVGAGEGALKRSVGVDPLLQTIITANRV